MEALETMNVSRIVAWGGLWTSKSSPSTSKEPRPSLLRPPREPLGALLIAFCYPHDLQSFKIQCRESFLWKNELPTRLRSFKITISTISISMSISISM